MIWKTGFFIGAILLLLGNIIILKPNPPICGDGYEYMLMTESILNHASFEARLSDIKSIRDKFIKRDRFDQGKYFSNYERLIQNKTYADGYGYFRGNNGKYYSYHFWLYPLLNVPALWLTDIIGKPPSLSFPITNSLIILSALFFILYRSSLTKWQKIFITAFYLLGGTTFYLNWSHPEVFTTSFLLVGLILALDRKFISAAFLFALAAQQNPPLGLLALMALFIGAYFQYLEHDKKRAFNFVLQTVAILAILTLSPLFYYAFFHTFNLIDKSGFADIHLISLKRLFSFYFDINQGMIVGIPWLFIILPATFVFAFKNQKKLNNKFLPAIAYLVSAFVIAIPTFSTTNWNAGLSVFMRYAYWAAMPLALTITSLLPLLSIKAQKILVSLFILGQGLWVIQYGIDGHRSVFCSKNTNLASFFIKHHPRYYNPIPEIFLERGCGRENANPDKVYFYVYKKKVVKILANANNQTEKLPFCDNKSAMELANLYPHNISKTENGWFYLNALPFCYFNGENGLYPCNKGV